MQTFRHLHFLSCALLALSFGAARADIASKGPLAPATDQAQQAQYLLAVDLFREHRFAAAYARFARLADAGHVRSAQLALLMYRNGAALFGSEWSATIAQQIHWDITASEDAHDPRTLTDDDRND